MTNHDEDARRAAEAAAAAQREQERLAREQQQNQQNQRDQANRTAAADQTAAIEALSATMASNLTLHNAISTIPPFDGTNMALKDYIQTLRNSTQYVSPNMQGSLVLFVLNKLRGRAKNSTYGHQFANIEELIAHLKRRFAQGKTFNYYLDKINNLYMGSEEDVSDFKDRLNVLLGCAEAALKEEKGNAYNPAMITPTQDRAVDVFLKGLPSEMSRDIDSIKPTTLEEAYKEAVRLETRMNAKIIPDLRPRGRSSRRDEHNDRERRRDPRFDDRDVRYYDDRRESSRIRFIEEKRPNDREDKPRDDRSRNNWSSRQTYPNDRSRDRSTRDYTPDRRSRDYTPDRRSRDYTPERRYRNDRTPDRPYQRDYTPDRRRRDYTPDRRFDSYDRYENPNPLNSSGARHTPQVASQGQPIPPASSNQPQVNGLAQPNPNFQPEKKQVLTIGQLKKRWQQ